MKKSIARIGTFTATAGENGAVTYGAVDWLESKLSGGREYSADPVGESAEVYADGMVVYSAEENSGYTIKLTLLALIDKIAKEWLGYTVDESGKSIAEYADGRERPYFGLAVAESTTGGETVTSYYYSCQLTKRITKSGKTSEGKFDPQFPEFEIAARPRETDMLVCYEVTTPGGALPTVVPEPKAAE